MIFVDWLELQNLGSIPFGQSENWVQGGLFALLNIKQFTV